MGPSDQRFVPLVPMGVTEPSKLSPKWMYSGLPKPDLGANRPSMNDSVRAPEVNQSRSSSPDGTSEGVDFPLRSTTSGAGRRRDKYAGVIAARWAWTKRHRKPLMLLALIGR